MIPEIKCSKCYEGTTVLHREAYGYIVIAIALAMVLVLGIWTIFKRYNAALVSRLVDFQEQSMYIVKDAMSYRKRQQKLQKLKPKLKVIEQRLKAQTKSTADVLSVRGVDEGGIVFDAQRMFDILDVNGDGELSYDELNVVLKLHPAAIHQFAQLMNKEAGEPADAKGVSRPVFTRHFLGALEASSNLQPTAEEAAELFNEIKEEQGAMADGSIPFNHLFTSSLSEFLTDAQINEILKRFQKITAHEGDEENGAVPESENPSRNRRRSSVFFGASRAARTITREEFVTRYPQFLMEVTNPDQTKKMEENEKEGVDMAFENLCLTINGKDKSIRVVNDVTGRLPAGTMTALMGGSGAVRFFQ